jgi:hypothetical protein
MPTHTESLSHSQIPKIAYRSTKLGEIFYAGVYRKMFLEVHRWSFQESGRRSLVCLQVREDQKEQTNVFITC